MQNTKYFLLANKLNKTQINRFGKFIRSPYHNDNEDLVNFYHEFHRNKVDTRDKKEIWKEVYKTAPFSNQKFNRILSDLFKLLEQFMVIEELNDSPLLINSIKSTVVNRHGIKKIFDAVIRDFETELKRNNNSAIIHYFNYRIQNEINDFNIRTGIYNKLEYAQKSDLELDTFYIIKKLHNFSQKLDYQRKLQSNLDIELPNGLIDYLFSKGLDSNSTLKSYYLVVRLLQKPHNEEYFNELNTFLLNNADNIYSAERKQLFFYLMNYCVDIQINNGNSSYYEKLFNIYKISLNHGIFINNGVFSHSQYKNIISVGVFLKEFDWVDEFIHLYTEQLSKENRENALNYNLAKVAYHRKDYNNVIDLLHKVEYSDITYALGSRVLLLQTYYETDSFLSFESMVVSFTAYIKRNKQISYKVKRQYLNLISLFRRIYQLAPFDKKKAQKLKDKIMNTEILAGKHVLLEKLKEKTGV